MPLYTLQNFFKTTVSTAWAVGTGNRYITTLPTATSGRLVINPAHSTKREIIEYSAKGTDGGGNYITVSVRGVGGTTNQTHDINEPVRSNVTAEVITDIQTELDLKLDDTQLDTDGTLAANSDTKVASQKATKTYSDLRVLKAGDTMTGALILNTSSPSTALQAASKGYADGLAIAGAPNASTTVKGIVEEATQAQFDASTDTGETGARLFVVPSVIQTGVNTQTLVAGEALTINDAVFVSKGDEGRILSAYSTTNTVGTANGGVTWNYQSFTTGANTVKIIRVKLYGSTSGSGGWPGAGTLRIRSTPNGSDLYSTTISVPFNGGEITADNIGITVSPSTTYYIVVSTSNPQGGSNTINGGTVSSYSGGVSGVSSDSGANWTTPATTVTGDFYFEVLEGDYIAGKAYKTVAATNYYSGNGLTANFIGFAKSSVSAAANIGIKTTASMSGFSGLTPGTTYYLSNTAGAISTTAGTTSKKIGLALSATELLIKHDN